MQTKGIRVLYFADAARRAGIAEEHWVDDDLTSLHELQTRVFERHPSLAELRESLLWSVDEVVVPADAPLSDGKVVGVLPPFSGG